MASLSRFHQLCSTKIYGLHGHDLTGMLGLQVYLFITCGVGGRWSSRGKGVLGSGGTGSVGLSTGTALNDCPATPYIRWWQASRESALGDDLELTRSGELS